ncbi:hypothetical protein AC520_0965 [Enterobacter sp. OLF]|nr:hypothetical protein AC520_0965 [Enterobacter sp. OLF]
MILFFSRLFIDFNQQGQAINSAHFHPSYFINFFYLRA